MHRDSDDKVVVCYLCRIDVCGGLQVVYSKEDTLQTQRQVWKIFQPYNVVNIVVSIYLVVIAVCGLYPNGTIVSRAEDVYEKPFTSCSKTDRKHIVVGDDTLARIATYYGLKEQMMVAYNHLTGHSVLHVGQSICIQNASGNAFNRNLRSIRAWVRVTTRMRLVKPVPHPKQSKRARPARSQPAGANNNASLSDGYAFRNPLAFSGGFTNVFSYGQCTWWAAQRYFQLHNVVVPWRSQANAGQWTARAYENGWRVSGLASVGSILVLQGGVQGAGAVGHVGIVEQVLNDGTAIVSSMTWGYGGGRVSLDAVRPGPGVAFLEQ